MLLSFIYRNFPECGRSILAKGRNCQCTIAIDKQSTVFLESTEA
ncbi:hypothetical protein Cs308_0986 [Candidatus Chlamydia sanziniae]|uniref:Uncharacterized protein n=1 Tax=Candidatus Chlamydia sanziniae TaxID=1806891 RepID=A0A1A9HYZ7_9CHLA|nr:hypothetical protein Cs308_0986 [Candidatus Chlamydia sanziniae]